MMSYRQPDELPDIPIAGRQVGDTNLLTREGVVHLPDCSIFGGGYTSDGKPVCSCGSEAARRIVIKKGQTPGKTEFDMSGIVEF